MVYRKVELICECFNSLHTPRWAVTADVQNAGGVYGCDVPQLYVAFPEGSGEPVSLHWRCVCSALTATRSQPRVLRGFERITLEPWQAEQVRFPLSRYDLAIWDTELQRWRIPEGDFTIYVTSQSAFDENPLSISLPSDWLPNGKGDDIYAW